MSHYRQNVFYRISKAIQLLVASIPREEKKIVHSYALESRGLRVENVNKIDEIASHFSNLNLRYAESLRGFDPNTCF
jgi:hypothetical protein